MGVVDCQNSITVKSVVSQVKNIKKGTYLGYSRSFCADRDMKMATVSIGYSDILRLGENEGAVLVDGKKCKVIGGVCMDQLMVDASDCDNIKLGDEAILLGKTNTKEIALGDFGKFMGCTPEEVYCHLTKRLHYVYTKKGQLTHHIRFLHEKSREKS